MQHDLGCKPDSTLNYVYLLQFPTVCTKNISLTGILSAHKHNVECCFLIGLYLKNVMLCFDCI